MRRNAFIAGVLGVIISDIIYAIGFTHTACDDSDRRCDFDTAVLAGNRCRVCELVGETSKDSMEAAELKENKVLPNTSMLSQKTEKRQLKG